MNIFSRTDDAPARVAGENLADLDRAKEHLLKVSARCEQFFANHANDDHSKARAFAQRAMAGRILDAVLEIVSLQAKIRESVGA